MLCHGMSCHVMRAGCMHGWMGWVDAMDGWMHGWLAGWMDGWMDGCGTACGVVCLRLIHSDTIVPRAQCLFSECCYACPSSGRGPGHGLRDRCRGLGGDSGCCRLQLLSSSLWLSSWLLFRNTPDLPDAVAPMVVS